MRESERPFTTALFLLRCVQLGLSLDDLDRMTVGMVFDIMLERGRDDEEWKDIATEKDIEQF